VLLGWEHRNLLGSGELFEILASVNDSIQSLDFIFRKPNFLRNDQQLVARTNLIGEETDAYESTSVKNAVKIERDLTESLTAGAGVGLDYLDVEENGESDTFVLLSFPLSLSLDTRDDILDPTRGFRVDFLPTPFIEAVGANANYLKYDLVGNTYLHVMDEKRLVVALRGRLGQILGAGSASVPATERFYAGGGGSVRGYPFQSLSPLDMDERDPAGGRSLVELSLEMRSRISERFGLVAFLDGGRAYESNTPDFDKGLFWGAGLGLRVYTPIGPVRLDVAFPLESLEHVDDAFQIYVSLGQSF
jgi:translocation and assembly module TamA